MTPADRESFACGGHAYASDLTNWSFVETPAYSRTLQLADGGTLNLTRRERPQLLLGGPDGRTPLVLYNGVSVAGQNPFTFAQKLGP